MKTSDLKPWNWFRNENDNNNRHFSLPTRQNTHDVWRGMQEQMDEMFEAIQKNVPSWPKSFIKPDIDIRETNDSYEITAEIPGVEENNISLEVRDHILILKGEKKAEYEEGEKDSEFHRIERSYGSFKRVLNLPEDVKPDSAEASFNNGVLTITLQRSPLPKDRHKIKIKEKKHAS
jgi:HSP20 family protein